MGEEEPVTVYKTFDDGYIVRSMRKSETGIVNKWYTSMGITPRDDLLIVWDVFPRDAAGLYIGEYQGKVVASSVRLHWGDDAFYGSLYYCDTSFRRKHFGTRLRDDVALSRLGTATLYVDAVEGFVADTNVKKFGYTDMFKTFRYEGEAKDVDCHYSGILKNVSDVSFAKIIDYDNKCFISKDFPTRRQFLQRLLTVPDGASCVALDNDGTVIGLACRRPAIQSGHHLVGPLYANSLETATALLTKLCKNIIGDRVTINIWQPKEEAMALVQHFNMKEVFSVRHQYVNGPSKDINPHVYGVTCLDVCGF